MNRILMASLLSIIIAGEAYSCETSDLIMNLSSNHNDPPVILTRPITQHSWEDPDGIFKFHYDTEGPRAVFNAEIDVDPPDGVPDYVNRAADYLNLAHYTYVNNLGFDPPPYDDVDDQLYDIYLTEIPAITRPENLSTQYPGREAYTSYIELGFDLRTPRYPEDPLPFLKVSAAHEYFHAVEFAYRAYSSDSTAWWFESCAGWAEEVVFDDVNDVYYKLDYYLPDLHKSLYQSPGFFIYGSWLFSEFLGQRHGSLLIRKCWEKFATFDFAINAIDLTLDDDGLDFNDEYVTHMIWNYFTGNNYREGFYEEGSNFPENVFIAATYLSYPVEWTSEPLPQENLSAAYISFENTITGQGSLVIEYLNNNADKHGVAIITLGPGSSLNINTHLIQNFIVNTFTVEQFQNCQKVIMIPIWLYEGVPISGVTSFTYSAHIDTAVVGVLSGQPEMPSEFGLENIYPNPFNGSVQIRFNSPDDARYMINIYNISGEKVFQTDFPAEAGSNRFRWIPSAGIASGIHFFDIVNADRRAAGKFLYLK